MTTWCVIPVRGDSQGLPGKNRRNLKGKPLISYSIENALTKLDKNKIFVASDDEELLSIASTYGVETFSLKQQSGKETLDEVLYQVVSEKISEFSDVGDIIITLQATCPLLSADTLDEAVKQAQKTEETVMTVTDSRHLYWEMDNSTPIPHYKKRLNRQELPEFYKETGAIIACSIDHLLTTKTRITSKPHLIIIDKEEALDIDSFQICMLQSRFLRKEDFD